MTIRFNCNVVSSGAAQNWFDFKEFMKSSPPDGPGWAVTLSGNGTGGLYGAGDVITSSSMFYTNSWFVLQDPSGNREILFHFTDTNNSLIMDYSRSSGFTGGSASVPAAATDSARLWHYYTFENTGSSLLRSASPHYLHMWADDDNEYSFFVFTLQRGTRAVNGGLFFMDEVIGGDNLDSVVFGIGANSTDLWDRGLIPVESPLTSGDSSCLRGWAGYGTDKQTFQAIPGNTLRRGSGGGVLNIPSEAGKNQFFDGGIQFFPIIVAGRSSNGQLPPIYKGVLKNIKWVCSPAELLETASVVSHRDHLIMDAITIPWDGTVPLV